MTKEQILQKHFTSEFGDDGHGKFMQYILDAMEEYANQPKCTGNVPIDCTAYGNIEGKACELCDKFK